MSSYIYNALFPLLDENIEKVVPNNGSNQLGTVFSDNFARVSLGSNWSIHGSSSFVTDGSKLIMSGGSGVLTDYIQYESYITCLELWQLEVKFKPTVISYGLGIGINSINPFDNRSMRMQIACDTGFLYIAAGSQSENNSSDATKALPISANDELVLTVNRRYNSYTLIIQNLTQNKARTYVSTYTLDYDPSVSVPHNTGKIALFNYAGTMEVTSFKFSSVQTKVAKCLFIGDSITYGLFASTNTNRFVNIVSCLDGIVNSNAGGSDTTAEVLSRITELISLQPKRIALMIGGNDINFGVSSGTWQANYLSIRNQLFSSGIEIIHLLSTPRSGTNVVPLNTFINSEPTFTADTIIDTYSNLQVAAVPISSYYAVDLIHPNKAGHSKIADAILTQMPNIVS